MLIKRFFRRAEKNTGLLAEEPSQPAANSLRVKKATGKYPTLRAAIVSGVNRAAEEDRDRSDPEALLQVEELVEVTELALLSYCHSLFDAKVAKLRMELFPPDSE